MTNLLRGSAFITGAASGIGQHTALAFARHGITKLALADINLEALQTSNIALKEQFPHVAILTLHLDVRNPSQVKEGIAKVVAQFGRLDIAVNNAGISGSGRQTHEIENDEWLRVLDVNLQASIVAKKRSLQLWSSRRTFAQETAAGELSMLRACLLWLRLVIAWLTLLTRPPSMVRTRRDSKYANSYGGMGIRINAICPRYVETPLLKNTMAQDPNSPLAADLARTPLKRLATMEEVGDCIVLMASPMNSFMQGASIVCDGGFTTN